MRIHVDEPELLSRMRDYQAERLIEFDKVSIADIVRRALHAYLPKPKVIKVLTEFEKTKLNVKAARTLKLECQITYAAHRDWFPARFPTTREELDAAYALHGPKVAVGDEHEG